MKFCLFICFFLSFRSAEKAELSDQLMQQGIDTSKMTAYLHDETMNALKKNKELSEYCEVLKKEHESDILILSKEHEKVLHEVHLAFDEERNELLSKINTAESRFQTSQAELMVCKDRLANLDSLELDLIQQKARIFDERIAAHETVKRMREELQFSYMRQFELLSKAKEEEIRDEIRVEYESIVLRLEKEIHGLDEMKLSHSGLKEKLKTQIPHLANLTRELESKKEEEIEIQKENSNLRKRLEMSNELISSLHITIDNIQTELTAERDAKSVNAVPVALRPFLKRALDDKTIYSIDRINLVGPAALMPNPELKQFKNHQNLTLLDEGKGVDSNNVNKRNCKHTINQSNNFQGNVKTTSKHNQERRCSSTSTNSCNGAPKSHQRRSSIPSSSNRRQEYNQSFIHGHSNKTPQHPVKPNPPSIKKPANPQLKPARRVTQTSSSNTATANLTTLSLVQPSTSPPDAPKVILTKDLLIRLAKSQSACERLQTIVHSQTSDIIEAKRLCAALLSGRSDVERFLLEAIDEVRVLMAEENRKLSLEKRRNELNKFSISPASRINPTSLRGRSVSSTVSENKNVKKQNKTSTSERRNAPQNRKNTHHTHRGVDAVMQVAGSSLLSSSSLSLATSDATTLSSFRHELDNSASKTSRTESYKDANRSSSQTGAPSLANSTIFDNQNNLASNTKTTDFLPASFMSNSAIVLSNSQNISNFASAWTLDSTQQNKIPFLSPSTVKASLALYETRGDVHVAEEARIMYQSREARDRNILQAILRSDPPSTPLIPPLDLGDRINTMAAMPGALIACATRDSIMTSKNASVPGSLPHNTPHLQSPKTTRAISLSTELVVDTPQSQNSNLWTVVPKTAKSSINDTTDGPRLLMQVIQANRHQLDLPQSPIETHSSKTVLPKVRVSRLSVRSDLKGEEYFGRLNPKRLSETFNIQRKNIGVSESTPLDSHRSGVDMISPPITARHIEESANPLLIQEFTLKCRDEVLRILLGKINADLPQTRSITKSMKSIQIKLGEHLNIAKTVPQPPISPHETTQAILDTLNKNTDNSNKLAVVKDDQAVQNQDFGESGTFLTC